MTDSASVHVIDDDEAVRDSLAFLLDCAGLPVRVHVSADAFLNAAPSLDGAVVVTDVRMPGMNGIDLAAHLKKTGVSVPVIVITGHADVPLAIQAMKAGVVDFIEKPFDDKTLVAAVKAAMDRQQARGSMEVERQAIRARLATLSGREREVLDGLVEGHANKAIAFDLDISARTVEVYRANVMTKMRAETLSDLVKMVMIERMMSI